MPRSKTHLPPSRRPELQRQDRAGEMTAGFRLLLAMNCQVAGIAASGFQKMHGRGPEAAFFHFLCYFVGT